jgi:ribosomal protein S19E (S16A)
VIRLSHGGLERIAVFELEMKGILDAIEKDPAVTPDVKKALAKIVAKVAQVERNLERFAQGFQRPSQ